jgi:hypothetical protein
MHMGTILLEMVIDTALPGATGWSESRVVREPNVTKPLPARQGRQFTHFYAWSAFLW